MAPRWQLFVTVGLLALTLPAIGDSDERASYFMDPTEELALARTAGPAAVTAEATVYVLTDAGYEVAEAGSNGFHCFVERSWGAPRPDNAITFDPRVRAPHCINPEGARTKMREFFFIARLALAGMGSDEINARVEKAYASGELQEPSGLALTYMMSKHQWLGERVEAWKPHVMIWSPGLTEAELGTGVTNPGNGTLLVGKPGSRRACLVVAVPEFIG